MYTFETLEEHSKQHELMGKFINMKARQYDAISERRFYAGSRPHLIHWQIDDGHIVVLYEEYYRDDDERFITIWVPKDALTEDMSGARIAADQKVEQEAREREAATAAAVMEERKKEFERLKLEFGE